MSKATTKSNPQPSGPQNATLALDDLIGYNLRRAHYVQRARFASVFAPYRIRPMQLLILGLLSQNKLMKQGELCKELGVKPTNIVTLIDELEDRKLIVRRYTRTDKRSRALQLTPAGKRFTAELLPLHESLEQSVSHYLSKAERAELLRLLKKFRAASVEPELDYDDP